MIDYNDICIYLIQSFFTNNLSENLDSLRFKYLTSIIMLCFIKHDIAVVKPGYSAFNIGNCYFMIGSMSITDVKEYNYTVPPRYDRPVYLSDLEKQIVREVLINFDNYDLLTLKQYFNEFIDKIIEENSKENNIVFSHDKVVNFFKQNDMKRYKDNPVLSYIYNSNIDVSLYNNVIDIEKAAEMMRQKVLKDLENTPEAYKKSYLLEKGFYRHEIEEMYTGKVTTEELGIIEEDDRLQGWEIVDEDYIEEEKNPKLLTKLFDRKK